MSSSSGRKGITKKHTRLHAAKRPQTTKCPKPPYPFESNDDNTAKRGQHALEWLIYPVPMSVFFSSYFEKKPLYLRNAPKKFSSLASIPAIKQLLMSRKLKYSELDVTSYTPSAGRETHNGEGIAGKEAWEKYSTGCSLRLRRPQPHFPAIHQLCTYLESFLECVVGANIYVTPPVSQGFAAHFDDVDVLICQIAGEKQWRVYKRDDEHDVLPRRSSVDFSADEVSHMKLVMDVVLQQGDMLYLPRGAVHEATAAEQESLHVTISFCQRWTWADLLLGSFERAILETAATDRRLREAVPLRFGRVAGVGIDGGLPGTAFAKMVKSMAATVAKNYPTDFAADKMMERFVTGRLPVKGSPGAGEVSTECKVCLVASACVRLVVGDDGLPVLVTHDGRQSCLPEEAAGIKFVIDRYPEGVKVEDIPLEKLDDRVELARGLVDLGVLKVLR